MLNISFSPALLMKFSYADASPCNSKLASQRKYFSSRKRRVYRPISFYTMLDSSERNFGDRYYFIFVKIT